MLALNEYGTGGLVTIDPADISHFKETAHATEIRFRGGRAVLVAEPYWQVAQLVYAYLEKATRQPKGLFARITNLL